MTCACGRWMPAGDVSGDVVARVESELVAWERGIEADVAMGTQKHAVEALQRLIRHIRAALAARSDQGGAS